ncbi:MAG: sister chromatid cohesion protein 1 [Alyxoria varia]|nr:MAG: sister chromatid cohesion protein 1 [Alyxoria varia]
MFYSETLLSKTGPLARVWLSANLERKLSKSAVVQQDLQDSVHEIVKGGHAPIALRLSGQLLLGVVRIYSRKARYLLDDCNEAILKIKMAFKSGNVDLPANQSNTANPASLTLPDVLTELDLLAPGPDPSLLLSQPLEGGNQGPNDSLLGWDTNSQELPSTIERGRGASVEEPGPLDDVGLELEFGDDTITPTNRKGREIEVGRDAPAPRSEAGEEDTTMKLPDDDLGLDLGGDDAAPGRDSLLDAGHGLDNDLGMGGMDDVPPLMDDGVPPPLPSELDFAEATAEQQRARDSMSPLSSLHDSVFETHDQDQSVHQAQRAKKRKILQVDPDTEIHSNQIRAQQNDRSKILKPAAFLPRDPMLLALMEMQKNGGFVSNILGDGRSRGWAPELRGVLSLEVVRGSGENKRKRDSSVAGGAREESTAADIVNNQRAESSGQEDGMINIPADDDMPPPPMEDDEMQPAPGDDGLGGYDFDETTMPILHPADSGPVSLGTKHAVHLLRDKFGPGAADSPSKRQKSSVVFQDLLPEKRTTRADATKMFFEVLVLATKDAVKVDQDHDALGGALRVRGKRGLWGSWAEMEAGGEIAEQSQQVA